MVVDACDSRVLVRQVPDSVPIVLPKMNKDPLVSIIVPSFNQGMYIHSTITSILSQEYRPIQIVVIDGGSQDQTVSVLKSFGPIPELEWISEPDSGVVEAVNKGFDRARGQIVAIQSSDDCYLPDILRKVVGEFECNDQLGLLYGDTVKIDADGRELSRNRIGSYSLLNLLRIRTWIPQPSAFFRRELLDILGGWDDRIPYAPDTDLWLRMAFCTQVKKLDAFLSQRRLHGEQRDKQAAKISRDYSRMIEQSEHIAKAPREVRRAARAGAHLMRVRYNATGSDWNAAWNLLKAGMYDRSCLDVRGIATHAFCLPIRRRLSTLKQAFKRRFGM